jgi:dihydropteroate synthase
VACVREILGLPAPLSGIGRCLVMGVVNVTPDSFSDGGQWFEPEAAVRHGVSLVAAGADLVDVGGESTRPGAARVGEAEERRRVLPVVAALAAAGVQVSIDSTRAGVARAALEAGAVIVNDVSGGRADPAMAALVAEAAVPYVVMHWRGHSDVMESLARYDHVVAEVCAELSARVAALVAAGIDRRQLILDPGFGFAKRAGHNWELLAGLQDVLALGRPVLVGTSRKRFLADAVTEGAPAGSGTDLRARDHATAATSVIAAVAGAWAVRVHDVPASADAVRVAELVGRAGGPG